MIIWNHSSYDLEKAQLLGVQGKIDISSGQILIQCEVKEPRG